MLRHTRVWRYLDEVARCGSVRQAAERLNVTPSAVLRRIQDVEEDLGEPLFERTSSGMLLTTAGELFIDWIRKQNADLEVTRSLIEEISGIRRGSIRIVSSQAMASWFLPSEIATFQSSHPDVIFKMQTASHEEAIRLLIDYEADLAFIFGPPLRPEVQAHVSVGQRIVAVMREGHPLSARGTLRLRHCLDYPLALLDKSFAGRRLIDDAMAKLSHQGKVVFESNSFRALAVYARHSDAITFQVQIGTSSADVDEGLAILPLADEDEAYAPLVLLHLKGRALPLAARRFADQLARRLTDLRMQPLPAKDVWPVAPQTA